MLYVCSLALKAKKASGIDQVYQAPLNKVISQLNLDPEISNMNAVLLGPGDLSGVNKSRFLTAVGKGVHPKVCIMYIYEKESEAKDVQLPYMKGVRKISPDEISKFVVDTMDDFLSNTGQLDADIEALREAEVINPVEEVKEVKAEIPQDMTSFIQEPEPPKVEVIPEIVIPDTSLKQPVQKEVPPPPAVQDAPRLSRGEMLENIRSAKDWAHLHEALQTDAITKQLIEENADYHGAVQMLEVMDNKIKTIWLDNSLSADRKFEKITEIGMEKSTLRAVSNSAMVTRVMDIIDSVVICAKRVVNEKVESVNGALAKITTDTEAVNDDSKLVAAMQERTDLQLELSNMLLDLRKLYSNMDTTASATIEGLNSDLPSNNPFINNMLTPTDTEVFTPTNTTQLAKQLLTCLQNNNITMSALEDKLESIIRLTFTLFNSDSKIQEHYKNLCDMLKAQRVEDVVVRDTVLKYVLNVYIGDDDTGRTATALTWSGIQSRRYNTLLIDISGKPHFDRYGETPISLSEFLVSRIEKQLCCVQSERRLDTEEVQQLISEIRTRLNYYGVINIIVHPEDRMTLSMLAKEALTFNYITDCRGRSIETIKQCMGESSAYGNLAQRLIVIDSPIHPLQIAEAVCADFTKIRLILLPNMTTIRACALKKDRPYEYSDIRAIFEEAFR